MIKSELQSVLDYWCYGQHRADIIIQVLTSKRRILKKKKKKKRGIGVRYDHGLGLLRSLSKALTICHGGYLVGSTKYTLLVRKISVWFLLLDPHYLGLSHVPPTKLSFYPLHYIKVCFNKHQYLIREAQKKSLLSHWQTNLDLISIYCASSTFSRIWCNWTCPLSVAQVAPSWKMSR